MPTPNPQRERYDLVVVGTGFASSFFLSRYLQGAAPRARILVLERGRVDPHPWQVKYRKNSSFPKPAHIDRNPKKHWEYTLGFGGTSNRWWACTPRCMPNDFRLASLYGQGRDWPVGYEELEPYYERVEEVMQVSGPSGATPFPRRKPYPQPPHLPTEPDRVLARAHPRGFFQQPTARASRALPRRPRCCANGTCTICPVNAKFTIQNGLDEPYADERVQVIWDARVERVLTRGDSVTSVQYAMEEAQATHTVDADLVVLGANALFNPHILLRSEIEHPLLGKRLVEQVGQNIAVYLDGLDNFQGSTSITGHGYMLYDGEHRKERAGCLIEAFNIPSMRAEHGRWRQVLRLKCIFEDLPSEENRVVVNEADPRKAEAVFSAHSQYTQRGIDSLPGLLPEILKALPVESIEMRGLNKTEAHILGTTVMGDDPATSVIDKHQVHHRYRNLVVLGGGAFPTAPPANPTLTISALTLFAADHLLG